MLSPPFAFYRLLRSVARYHRSVLWQELEQERVVAFQPMVVVRFLTPLLWVAAFTVVVL